jgi:hypothetical protein
MTGHLDHAQQCYEIPGSSALKHAVSLTSFMKLQQKHCSFSVFCPLQQNIKSPQLSQLMQAQRVLNINGHDLAGTLAGLRPDDHNFQSGSYMNRTLSNGTVTSATNTTGHRCADCREIAESGSSHLPD